MKVPQQIGCLAKALGCCVSSGGGGQGALWGLFCEGTSPIHEGPILLTWTCDRRVPQVGHLTNHMW